MSRSTLGTLQLRLARLTRTEAKHSTRLEKLRRRVAGIKMEIHFTEEHIKEAEQKLLEKQAQGEVSSHS